MVHCYFDPIRQNFVGPARKVETPESVRRPTYLVHTQKHYDIRPRRKEGLLLLALIFSVWHFFWPAARVLGGPYNIK